MKGANNDNPRAKSLVMARSIVRYKDKLGPSFLTNPENHLAKKYRCVFFGLAAYLV